MAKMDTLYCSFCGKSQSQVQKLIAGNRKDVYICDECVELCSELLEEELFEQMLEALKEEHDYIIVDTPPMGHLIDGAIIARHCDGAVMVIESGAVSYRLEQKVKEQIEKAGRRVLGAVLNKVDIKSRPYYGRYGKYRKYKKYDRY